MGECTTHTRHDGTSAAERSSWTVDGTARSVCVVAFLVLKAKSTVGGGTRRVSPLSPPTLDHSCERLA